MARAIATRCCSPPLSSRGNASPCAPDRRWPAPRSPSRCALGASPRTSSARRTLSSARRASETDDRTEKRNRLSRRSLRQLWVGARVDRPRTRTSRLSASACSRARRAAWSCRCRTVPSASVSSPAGERQADAPRALHPAAPSPSAFARHRPLRSPARSLREYAGGVDAHHVHDGGDGRSDAHDDGEQNRPTVRRSHHDRQCRVGGQSHDDQIDRRGDGEADDGAEQRLADDDLEDVAAAEPMARSVANSFRWSLVLE